MSKPRRKGSWLTISVVTVLLLMVMYVLSYPLVIKMREVAGPLSRAYGPVEWLIDFTPFRKPIVAWARLWREDDKIEVLSMMRDINRNGGGKLIIKVDNPDTVEVNEIDIAREPTDQ